MRFVLALPVSATGLDREDPMYKGSPVRGAVMPPLLCINTVEDTNALVVAVAAESRRGERSRR